MAKKIDTFALSTIIAILVFIWTYFIVKNIWWTIAISLIAYVLIWSILKIVKLKKKKKYSPDKLNNHFAIMGADYTVKFIFEQIDQTNAEIKENKYILINDANKEIIYPLFKFNNLSYDNIAQIYRTATENEVKKVYVLSNGIDKNALLLANGLSIKFEFVKTHELYKSLKDSQALPELVEFSDKPVSKASFKLLFQSILSPNATKYYIFTGVLLALMSFITPLSAYYVSISTISLVLGLITMMPFARDFAKDKSIFYHQKKTGNNTEPEEENNNTFTEKIVGQNYSNNNNTQNENEETQPSENTNDKNEHTVNENNNEEQSTDKNIKNNENNENNENESLNFNKNDNNNDTSKS